MSFNEFHINNIYEIWKNGNLSTFFKYFFSYLMSILLHFIIKYCTDILSKICKDSEEKCNCRFSKNHLRHIT